MIKPLPRSKNNLPTETDCRQQTFAFQDLGTRKVVGDFKGGNLSGDGGVVLLREVDKLVNLSDRLATCFTDFRVQHLIEHSVPKMLTQRIFGMAMGYEDLNDHESLRHDPMMAVGVGKKDPLGLDRDNRSKGRALAGKSTLNRLELTNAKTSGTEVITGGDHKIKADFEAIEDFLIEFGLEQIALDTKEIVLDFDATDTLLHGNQEGKFYHGYYGNYCYLPLYCFIGSWPVWARLRTSNRDACDGTIEALEKIVPAIRRRFPKARIILRADSGFAREAIFSWCENHDVFYVIGLAKNQVLNRRLTPAMFRAKATACLIGGYSTCFSEFEYRTAKSWSRARRVIGKAQVTPKGENPRFIVTNLPADKDRWMPEALYRKFYCARGDMENRIKEQQLELFSDRMSCKQMESNQLRLWFSTFAYNLMIALRERGLSKSKEFSNATPGTIRHRLLKVATMVKVSVRRVLLRWSGSFRYREEFAACCAALAAADR